MVSEEVITAVINFIGSKHSYVDAKPFIEALQKSQIVDTLVPPKQDPPEQEPDKAESEEKTE